MSKAQPTNFEILQVINELIARQDKLFAAQDKRFALQDKRFAWQDKQFADHVSRFDRIEAILIKQGQDIGEIKTDVADNKIKINHIYNVLDSHVGQIRTIEQENVMRDRQQERMTGWIKQLAKNTTTNLKPTP